MTQGFFTGGTAEGFSCFYFITENAGELVEQAERKESPSTLIPDVDNAAVGNACALFWGIPQPVSPCFLCFEKGGYRIH